MLCIQKYLTSPKIYASKVAYSRSACQPIHYIATTKLKIFRNLLIKTIVATVDRVIFFRINLKLCLPSQQEVFRRLS